METEKKRRAPGVGMHITSIRNIKEEINNVVERINEYQNKLNEEFKKTAGKSQVQIIKGEIKDLDLEIQNLNSQKRVLLDEKNKIQNEHNELKESLLSEKKKISYNSLSDLEKKEQEIQFRLMAKAVTAQQEREIAAELCEIKKKKLELQSLGSKESKLNSLFHGLLELKNQIGELKDKINEKQNSISTLKTQLEELSEQNKVKSPVIIDFENKINELKNIKDALYEKKKKEHEEIVRKEELWAKHQEEIAALMEIEAKRKTIKLKIRKLNEERNVLVGEKENFGMEKYDNIVESLQRIPNTKNFSIPLNLIQRISHVGLKIPKDKKGVDELINRIVNSKKDFEKSSDENIKKLEDKIKDLDMQILREQSDLEKMPETDIKLKKEEWFGIKG